MVLFAVYDEVHWLLSQAWQGDLLAFDVSLMTPSTIAFIAIVVIATLCALVIAAVYMDQRYGFMNRLKKTQVSNTQQYSRMINKMSRTMSDAGLLMKRESVNRELKLFRLNQDNRNSKCEICQRCVSDANLGSALSVFCGTFGENNDSFMCIDCFANIDTKELFAVKKLKDEWISAGGHHGTLSQTEERPVSHNLPTKAKSFTQKKKELKEQQHKATWNEKCNLPEDSESHFESPLTQTSTSGKRTY